MNPCYELGYPHCSMDCENCSGYYDMCEWHAYGHERGEEGEPSVFWDDPNADIVKDIEDAKEKIYNEPGGLPKDYMSTGEVISFILEECVKRWRTRKALNRYRKKRAPRGLKRK